MTRLGVQRLREVGPICIEPVLQLIDRHCCQWDYIVEWYKKVNEEKDRLWTEVITVKLTVLPDVSLEGQSKITKHLCQSIRCPFTCKFDLNLRKKSVKCCSWGIAFWLVLKLRHFGKQTWNTLEVLKCGAGGWRRLVGPNVWEMIYYKESRRRWISYIQ